MIHQCCVCHEITEPEDNRPGTVGNITSGYCKPCKNWNATAWALMMQGKMTDAQFHAAVAARREAKKHVV